MVIGIDPGRRTGLALVDECGHLVSAITVDAPDGLEKAVEWSMGYLYQWVAVEEQYLGPNPRSLIVLSQLAGMAAWAIGPGRGKSLCWVPARTWQSATFAASRIPGGTKRAASAAAIGIFGGNSQLCNEHVRDAALIAHYLWRRQRGV